MDRPHEIGVAHAMVKLDKGDALLSDRFQAHCHAVRNQRQASLTVYYLQNYIIIKRRGRCSW